MITVQWPVDRNKVIISSSWQDHLNRPGYNRAYAGTDLAGAEQPLRPSQFNGKILQAMWSTQGYGYTTFVEHGNLLRIRNAHQKNIAVSVGQIVNPQDFLGTLGTTGNSTGNHTHWEVWLKYDTGWRNIDPLDESMGIQIVNNTNELIPLGDDVPDSIPPPEFELPKIPELPNTKVTAKVTSWVNIRSLPKANSYDLGDIRPGDVCELCGYKVDSYGNIWFAIKKDDIVGWAAAYYNGQSWMQIIEGEGND